MSATLLLLRITDALVAAKKACRYRVMDKPELLSDAFMKWVTGEIDKETKRIIGEHKEQIESEIESTRKDIVARAGLRLAKLVDYHQMNDRLVITIHDKRGDD